MIFILYSEGCELRFAELHTELKNHLKLHRAFMFDLICSPSEQAEASSMLEVSGPEYPHVSVQTVQDPSLRGTEISVWNVLFYSHPYPLLSDT